MYCRLSVDKYRPYNESRNRGKMFAIQEEDSTHVFEREGVLWCEGLVGMYCTMNVVMYTVGLKNTINCIKNH